MTGKQMSTRIGAALVVALALGVVGSAAAQQPVTLLLTVTENRAPGAAGQVTLTALPDNQLRVEIRVTGLPPTVQRAAHIHAATGARCDTGAPIVYPLNNVQTDGSGAGASATTITLRPDAPIQANNAYVNIHQTNLAPGAADPGPGVLCATITTSFPMPVAPASAPAPPSGLESRTSGQPPATMARAGAGGIQAEPSLRWALAGAGALASLVGISLTFGLLRRRS